MSSNTKKPFADTRRKEVAYGVAGAMVVVLLTSVWCGAVWGHALAGLPAPAAHDPFGMLFEVLGRRVAWPLASTVVAVAVALAEVAVALYVVRLVAQGRRGRDRSRVDGSAKHMGRGSDIASLSLESAKRKADRFGVETPGVLLGRTVEGDKTVWGSWEDVYVVIAGPRTGKTTSVVVPTIVSAPGAVVATSNKRDIVDATRGVREQVGRTWVFDPQGITGSAKARWWWNPLSYVTDPVQAAKLAEIFAVSSRDLGAKTDVFFDNSGQTLLAGLLLAAATDGRPLTQVHAWLSRPVNQEAADILHQAGHRQMSESVRSANLLNDETRAGVFATALQMVDCLINPRIHPWIVDDGTDREHFDPTHFATTRDTVYSLSKEGRANAGPVVTALTVAVMEAAEATAAGRRGGRLGTPLLAVLDEAANVCRWKDLPSLYSHYGSRGIIPVTVLQSYSQGENAWGKEGMAMLWSAANVKFYGGGVSEVAFLEDLSRLVGEYETTTASVSRSHDWRSRSVQMSTKQDRIMDVHDLAALPAGRAVIVSSGARPTLVRTVPWMNGRYAAQIKKSLATYEP